MITRSLLTTFTLAALLVSSQASAIKSMSLGNFVEAPSTKPLSYSLDVNTPTNLVGKVDHDIFTGRNDIHLTWDMEISDDFESFVVTLDDVEVATTDLNDYILEDVADGNHVVGVSARYAGAQSEEVTAEFSFSSDSYAKATFNVASNNGVIPENLAVSLEGENGVYQIPVVGATAEAASLPKGSYVTSVEAKHYNAWSQDVVFDADKAVDINLIETLAAPFSLSVEEVLNEETNEYDYVMSWNSAPAFSDSFEDYDDFVTGEFGGWKTVNNNTTPSYSISDGQGGEISFPGSSSFNDPSSVDPMVFNPLMTTPSLEFFPSNWAYDGDKYVMFMGAMKDTSDKWLISPAVHVYEGFELSVMVHAYGDSDESETFRLLVSTTDNNIESFSLVNYVEIVCHRLEWDEVTMPLDEYAGQDVYIALNHVTYDSFCAFVDCFRVGYPGGATTADVGNVLNYNVKLNGKVIATVTEPTYTFSGLDAGQNTAAISANYVSGTSEETTYLLDILTSIDRVDAQTPFAAVTGLRGEISVKTSQATDIIVTDMAGRNIAVSSIEEGEARIAVAPGVYIVRVNDVVTKVVVR